MTSSFQLTVLWIISLLYGFILPSVASNAENHLNCQADALSSPPRNSGYQVSLCHDSQACQGVMKITHSTCGEHPWISENVTTNAYFQTHYGPDAYYAVLQGHERIVVNTKYVGNCVTEGTYTLASEGSYSLDVRLLYLNYEALTELRSAFRLRQTPVKIKLPMFTRGSRVGFKRKSIATYVFNVTFYNTPLVQSRYNITCSKKSQESKNFQPEPYCSRSDTPGLWTKMDPTTIAAIKALPAERKPLFIANISGYVWKPTGCRYAVLSWTKKEVIDCLRGRVVMAIGDSQVRYVYHKLLNKLLPSSVINNRRTLVSNLFVVEENEQEIIHLQYEIDPFLQNRKWYNFVETRLTSDVLIAGMGSWPAAGHKGLWTDGRFQSHIQTKAKELMHYRNVTKGVVIWFGIPAPAHPPKDYSLSRYRIWHMSNFANAVMDDAGIPVVDAFAVSEPMVHTSFDGCHYSNAVTETNAGILLDEVCRSLAKSGIPRHNFPKHETLSSSTSGKDNKNHKSS